MVQSNDCETVVKVYMIEKDTPKKIKIREPSLDTEIYQQLVEYFENEYNITEEMKKLIDLILSFYDSLIENMNKEEIIDFIERIIKNQK